MSKRVAIISYVPSPASYARTTRSRNSIGCASGMPQQIRLGSSVQGPGSTQASTGVNYLSPSERLPTVFKPTSSPPYMNGGPDEFLHWVIESTDPDVDPGFVLEVLGERLPQPVDDLARWRRC